MHLLKLDKLDKSDKYICFFITNAVLFNFLFIEVFWKKQAEPYYHIDER